MNDDDKQYYTKDEVNNLLANVSTTSVIIRDWSK